MQLYNKYCDGMLIVALRFVKDTMEAEDIVQDSYEKLWKNVENVNGEEKINGEK